MITLYRGLNLITLFKGYIFRFNSLPNNIQRFQSTSANPITSSFKSRAKLTEFYKLTHPDVLGNAPEKVREENLRSLKCLNAYLDALNQNSGTQEQNLKFYIAEKTNKKAKKYIYFEVKLQSLHSNSPSEMQQKIIDKSSVKLLYQRTIQTLVGNLQQTQQKINPLAKEMKEKNMHDMKQESYFKDKFKAINVEKSFQEHQYTMGPINKRQTKADILNKIIKQQLISMDIFQQVNKQQFNQTLESIRSEMYEMDTPQNKPLFWSRIILKESEYFKDIHKVLLQLIDPRLIFIDEKLSDQQINQFRDRFIMKKTKDSEFEKDLKIMQEIFRDMESSKPQIFLYITDKYSANDIIGYFSIPYNFNPSQMKNQYIDLKEEIITQRRNLEASLNKLDRTKHSLKKLFQIKQIKTSFAKDQVQLEQFILCLKQLQNYLLSFIGDTPIAKLLRDSIIIIGQDFAYSFSDNTIQIPEKLNQEDLQNFFYNLTKANPQQQQKNNEFKQSMN